MAKIHWNYITLERTRAFLQEDPEAPIILVEDDDNCKCGEKRIFVLSEAAAKEITSMLSELSGTKITER